MYSFWLGRSRVVYPIINWFDPAALGLRLGNQTTGLHCLSRAPHSLAYVPGGIICFCTCERFGFQSVSSPFNSPHSSSSAKTFLALTLPPATAQATHSFAANKSPFTVRNSMHWKSLRGCVSLAAHISCSNLPCNIKNSARDLFCGLAIFLWELWGNIFAVSLLFFRSNQQACSLWRQLRLVSPTSNDNPWWRSSLQELFIS